MYAQSELHHGLEVESTVGSSSLLHFRARPQRDLLLLPFYLLLATSSFFPKRPPPCKETPSSLKLGGFSSRGEEVYFGYSPREQMPRALKLGGGVWSRGGAS